MIYKKNGKKGRREGGSGIVEFIEHARSPGFIPQHHKNKTC